MRTGWEVSAPAQFIWGAATERGLRENNEDRHVAIPPVFAVCDGQGGCAAPEAAIARLSELAQAATVVSVDSLAAAVEMAEQDIQEIEGSADRIRDMEQAFRGGVRHQTSRVSWPATTLAGLALGEQGGRLHWIVFHVGQCRVYHWCAERGLTRLTRDHSVVQELMDAEQIDAEEALTHPQRHMVKKSLALRPRQHIAVRTEVEFAMRHAVPGERYLLCSDGVSAELLDTEIGSMMAFGADEQAVADRLVASAVGRGGQDNATAMVVSLSAIPGRDGRVPRGPA
jgi:PPM family protein phosphatase